MLYVPGELLSLVTWGKSPYFLFHLNSTLSDVRTAPPAFSQVLLDYRFFFCPFISALWVYLPGRFFFMMTDVWIYSFTFDCNHSGCVSLVVSQGHSHLKVIIDSSFLILVTRPLVFLAL